jgi:branched-chain amino acid transport system substrate-binding protein
LISKEDSMPVSRASFRIRRRTFLGAGLAAGVSHLASPFVISARAAEVIKIGLDNPLTGPLAALGKNELIGCQMAIDDINSKGGILGRTVTLVVEDCPPSAPLGQFEGFQLGRISGSS